MKKAIALVASLALAWPAVAQTLPPLPQFEGGSRTVDGDRLNALVQEVYRNRTMAWTNAADQPVCGGANFPGVGSITSTSATLQSAMRIMAYCPAGASYVRLPFTATATIGSPPVETDGTVAVPINIGVETNGAVPWMATASYAAGANVVYGNQFWTAAQPSTGQEPNAGNTAYWTAITMPAPTPVTCDGGRTCSIPTTTTTAGTTVTGKFITDRIPVNVPASGGWVAFDIWTSQPSGNNTVQLSRANYAQYGEYQSSGASVGDRSTGSGGVVAFLSSGSTYALTPFAIIGKPAVSAPSVCLIGDSITAGFVGWGLSRGTISGGTGFGAGDVWKTGTPVFTGQSAGAINSLPRYQITAVSSGVATVQIIDNGSLANTSLQPSQTLPSTTGPYTINFPTAAGTGVTTSSLAVLQGVYDQGPTNSYLAPGYWARALLQAGIPYAGFVRASDSLNQWVTNRDYTRLSYIAQSGCKTALVQLGVNDAGAGTAAATMLTNAQTLAGQLRGVGVQKVIFSTLTPQTAVSTDGFLTAGAQTPHANNGIVATYNAALRQVPAWADAVIEAGNCATTAQDSGIFKTDGTTVGLYTIDGIHPSSTGEPLMAACILPQLQRLVKAQKIY